MLAGRVTVDVMSPWSCRTIMLAADSARKAVRMSLERGLSTVQALELSAQNARHWATSAKESRDKHLQEMVNVEEERKRKEEEVSVLVKRWQLEHELGLVIKDQRPGPIMKEVSDDAGSREWLKLLD